MSKSIPKYTFLAVIIILAAIWLVNTAISLRFENQSISLFAATNGIYYTDTDLTASVSVSDGQGNPQPAKVNARLTGNGDESKKVSGDFDAGDLGSCIIKLPLEGLEDGDYQLRITASSGVRSEVITRQVKIASAEAADITVNFNKGIYKPGDEVLFRMLITSKNDSAPVKKEFNICIYDGNDNQVYNETVSSSDYGIISGRFVLADEVNSGTYRLLITSEDISKEETFEVDPYVLPKFEVGIDTDKNEYIMGDEMQITVSAKYFFGEPVNQGDVSVCIDYYGEEFFDSGTLNENGEYTFSFNAYEEGDYELSVEVTDNSNYFVEESKTIPVSYDVFEIELLAEHGALVSGIPNDLYIFTRKTDGSPVKTYLQLTSPSFSRQIATDDNGIGKFTVDSFESNAYFINIEAVDMDGNTVVRQFDLENVVQDVTIKTDKPKYDLGEPIRVKVINRLDAGSNTIFVYKNDRLLYMESTDDDEIKFDLGDTYGIIDIYAARDNSVYGHNAYNDYYDNDYYDHDAYSGYGGYAAYSHKTVFIDPGKSLDITLSNDKPEYKPGENVNLDISVTDNNGGKIDTALLVSVVDEAVLNLASNDLSIDNIKLALSDIKFSDDLDAATLYTSIVSNASEQAIMGLLLRQEPRAPGFQTSVSNNQQENRAAGIAVLFFILFVVALIYFLLWKFGARGARAGSGMIAVFLVLTLLASCGSGAPFSEDLGFGVGEPAPAAPSAPSDSPAPESAPPAPAAESPSGLSAPASGGHDTKTAKVRNMFLETMLFIPEMIAGNGTATVNFMLADNITTWNVQVVGNTKDGTVGYAESRLKAFQPFFADFELPKNCVRYDVISIPVTVFNYTDSPKEVTLTVKQSDWFLLETSPVQTVLVPSNQAQMVYIPINIQKFGDFTFRVDAASEGFSDAVEKQIKVNAEGYKVEKLVSSGIIDRDISQHILFMQDDIEKTRKATVRLYPSAMAQVVSGMENIFRMPTGCFEQISSSLYPNILALRYMEDNDIIDSELEETALGYITSGYQKLLTYEVKSERGGFSLYGDSPAETVLTAYGLMQLSDLSTVYNVDKSVLERMKEYLFEKQNRDGSFEITGHHMGGASSRDKLGLNAYIIWALSECYPDDVRLQNSVGYLETNMNKVEDNYTLALMANVFMNTGSAMAGEAIGRLAANAVPTPEGTAYIPSLIQDYYGSRDGVQELQATALTLLAMSKQNSHQNTCRQLIDYIISCKDSYGTWFSTQATILCLKALITYSERGELSDGQIEISINGSTKTIDIKKGKTLDLYQVTFDGLEKENIIEIKYPLEAQMIYEIAAEYHVPYDRMKDNGSFEIFSEMKDRLSVNEAVTQVITVINLEDVSVNNAMAVLQIPQGFRVDNGSLEALRHEGLIEKYETKYESINLYLRDFDPGEMRVFDIRYRPGYPANITGGQVRVYDYYNPSVEGIMAPFNIVVE